jgi:excisionase family DNA binding protein
MRKPKLKVKRRAETLKEAAAAWGVSYDSLYRLYRAGLFRTIRLGNKVLVPADEIERIQREGAPLPERDGGEAA